MYTWSEYTYLLILIYIYIYIHCLPHHPHRWGSDIPGADLDCEGAKASLEFAQELSTVVGWSRKSGIWHFKWAGMPWKMPWKCHGMPCLQGLDGVETYGKMQKVLTCQENFKSFSNLAGTPREQLVIDRRGHQGCQAVRGLLIIFLAMRDQHTTFLIHSFTLAISIWT